MVTKVAKTNPAKSLTSLRRSWALISLIRREDCPSCCRMTHGLPGSDINEKASIRLLWFKQVYNNNIFIFSVLADTGTDKKMGIMN
jgi:hypothetical protein